MQVNQHPTQEAVEVVPTEEQLSAIATNLAKTYNETKLHLIVNLINFESDLQINDLLNFLKLSNHYKSNKKSFVLVAPQIDVHQIPEELAIVPTLNEAFDIIEMENIERDLGF
ncbi:hypothetical protein SAMN05444278_10555 [Psychroflexus salarius]|uniref:Uncharacterized protein n=1 Tax=Psychroflexus salarius TaxID=1155689 RepID=A0A1M4W3I2_9FLAO|nr:hypothetical protein [Psychroflexus salarius]SHE75700.1 hypothetical protein SAMN05444278_10555 [Psychroflexus salarius]